MERRASSKANSNKSPKGGASSKKNESATTSKATAKAVTGHPVPEGLNVCYQVTENRKNPLSSYNSGHCAICKWEDVAPKGCKHPVETCFRRKGGPLKDVTLPGRRTTKSMEMSIKFREDRNKKKAATRAAKAKAKKGKKSVRTAVNRRVQRVTKDKALEEAMARGIPPGGRTDEELQQLNDDDWSEPSTTFKTRYLLNDEVKRTGKLTPDELDMLMPTFHREDKRQVDFTKKRFHSERGEHLLRAFRHSTYEFLRRNGLLHNNANYGYVDGSKPELKTFGLGRMSDKRTNRSKRKAKSTAAPYNTAYVSGSPAYAPTITQPKKVPRIEVTRQDKTNADAILAMPLSQVRKLAEANAKANVKANTKASAKASTKDNGKKGKASSTDNMQSWWDTSTKKPPPIVVEYRSTKGPELDMVVVDDKDEGDLSPTYQDNSPSPVRASEIRVCNPGDEKAYVGTQGGIIRGVWRSACIPRKPLFLDLFSLRIVGFLCGYNEPS